MTHRGTISPPTYDGLLALFSSVLLILILVLVLVLICKKRSAEPQNNLSVKFSAHSYPLTYVDATTDGFNHRRIIGKGHVGTVYGAVLATGEVVAVKRINPQLVLSKAGTSFSSAIKSLSLAHHPHIVPIIGFSEAPCERIILMEFMGMKSLDFHLHQNVEGATAFLDWGRRLRVAAEAAQGIEYLHEGMAPHVVHGCIKPSNILIDLNFHARVCDYGLSFLAPQEKRGLVGYVDGEFWDERGGLCKASDVYGFGVVLLELLSGRRCEEGLIVEWALPLIKESRVDQILDPRLGVPFDMRPLVRLAKVVLACVGNGRKNRPSIVQVAAILNNLEMKPLHLI
ncbi:protein kinase superfamily protein [Tasmannia lanceolata]|uniref:protein kinase superfamily protein n=1 Tax=Tasmannia lanceolata TaxID=3420 RepID=UPI004063F0D0